MDEDLGEPLQVATAELAPGERLIWADRPVPSRARGRIAVPLFGLLFAGAAGFWTYQASAQGPVALVGLVMIAIGLLIAVRALRSPGRQTVYAVTDRRLLIIQGGRFRRVRSFQPDQIESLERRERPDGSGDVIFGRETVARDQLRLRRDGPPNFRFRHRELGFFKIADVRRVEQAIRALREGNG